MNCIFCNQELKIYLPDWKYCDRHFIGIDNVPSFYFPLFHNKVYFQYYGFELHNIIYYIDKFRCDINFKSKSTLAEVASDRYNRSKIFHLNEAITISPEDLYKKLIAIQTFI